MGQRSGVQVAQEAGVRQKLHPGPAKRRDGHAEQRGPRSGRGSAKHHQAASPAPATQVFDIVQSDQAAHGMPNDINTIQVHLGRDGLDFSSYQRRGIADVSGMEEPQPVGQHQVAHLG